MKKKMETTIRFTVWDLGSGVYDLKLMRWSGILRVGLRV